MNDEQRKLLADEAADQIQSTYLDPIRDAIADAIDGAVAEALQPAEKAAVRKALEQAHATIRKWETMPTPNMGSANGAFFQEAVLNHLGEQLKELT